MEIKSYIRTLFARDSMRITGSMTEHVNQKKEKILVVFPGMTAVAYSYTYIALRDCFVRNGWDVFVIDTYSSEQVGEDYPRSLPEITMRRHVEDFDDVVDFFKSNYEQVFAAGHSIGGRVLITSNNKNLSGQVLLDPSGDTSNEAYKQLREGCYKYSKKMQCKYMDWGDGLFYPIGSIFEEMDCCPFPIVQKLVERLSVPTLFVAAGSVDYAKVYQHCLNNICDYVEIEGSEHDFIEYGAIEKIAQHCFNFFNKK